MNALFSSLIMADSTSSALTEALSSSGLWSAIAASMLTILLGFVLARQKLLPEKTSEVLSKIVMSVALPCLAFSSFMIDYTLNAGVETLINFVLSFVLYLFFIGLSRVIFFWVKDPTKRMVLGVLFAFGSTTFYAQPLIDALYSRQTYNDSNLQNIAFRVFLYSYAYVTVRGQSLHHANKVEWKATLRKICLNPILIATFLGLFLWLLQAIPGSTSATWWTVRRDWLAPQEGTISYVPFWRFDVTLPWIHSVFKMLGSLASPLVWLAIGFTLGSVPLSDSLRDKYAWIYAGMKTFLSPLLVLALLALFEVIGRACNYSSLITASTLETSILMWLVPPSTIASAYCIAYDKEKVLASDLSLVGILVSIPGIVVWVLALSLLASCGFFPA